MNQQTESIKDYQERVNEVLNYINKNLHEKLDLDTLAEIAHFSPFHFHRIVRSFINEPLGTFVTRIRLETAAGLIQHTDLSIAEVAFKVGYDSHSSFNRAFKKRFDCSPNEFKKEMNTRFKTLGLKEVEQDAENISFKLKPKIKEVKEKKAVYVQSIGEYSGTGTGEAWEKLFHFIKANKLFHWKMEAFGIGMDDPDITSSEKCRYLACMTVFKECKPSGEFGVMDLEGGKYAVFRYKGPYQNLDKVYNAIFRLWLPNSGFELRDCPVMEKYINNPGKTKPHKLLTDIYLPIK